MPSNKQPNDFSHKEYQKFIKYCEAQQVLEAEIPRNVDQLEYLKNQIQACKNSMNELTEKRLENLRNNGYEENVQKEFQKKIVEFHNRIDVLQMACHMQLEKSLKEKLRCTDNEIGNKENALLNKKNLLKHEFQKIESDLRQLKLTKKNFEKEITNLRSMLPKLSVTEQHIASPIPRWIKYFADLKKSNQTLPPFVTQASLISLCKNASSVLDSLFSNSLLLEKLMNGNNNEWQEFYQNEILKLNVKDVSIEEIAQRVKKPVAIVYAHDSYPKLIEHLNAFDSAMVNIKKYCVDKNGDQLAREINNTFMTAGPNPERVDQRRTTILSNIYLHLFQIERFKKMYLNALQKTKNPTNEKLEQLKELRGLIDKVIQENLNKLTDETNQLIKLLDDTVHKIDENFQTQNTITKSLSQNKLSRFFASKEVSPLQLLQKAKDSMENLSLTLKEMQNNLGIENTKPTMAPKEHTLQMR